MSYGQRENVGLPKFDSGEIPRGHIPVLSHSQPVCLFHALVIHSLAVKLDDGVDQLHNCY